MLAEFLLLLILLFIISYAEFIQKNSNDFFLDWCLFLLFLRVVLLGKSLMMRKVAF